MVRLTNLWAARRGDPLDPPHVNEAIGAGGPLEVLVNNTLYDGSKPRPFSDFTAVTTSWNTSYYSELPHEGETELWEIVNLTADAHPMHPHLVAFQVLNRHLSTWRPIMRLSPLYAAAGKSPSMAPGRGGYNAASVTRARMNGLVLGGNADPVSSDGGRGIVHRCRRRWAGDTSRCFRTRSRGPCFAKADAADADADRSVALPERRHATSGITKNNDHETTR
jgi:hypothetical protein